MKPVLIVIAGPNGSGKTTVTRRIQADHWSEGVSYLNPDDVAKDRFGDWNDEGSVLRAAQWATAERERLLSLRQSLAFETVLSTKEKLEFIAKAKSEGYFVRAFFVGTSDPTINVSRVG